MLQTTIDKDQLTAIKGIGNRSVIMALAEQLAPTWAEMNNQQTKQFRAKDGSLAYNKAQNAEKELSRRAAALAAAIMSSEATTLDEAAVQLMLVSANWDGLCAFDDTDKREREQITDALNSAVRVIFKASGLDPKTVGASVYLGSAFEFGSHKH